MTLRCLFVDFNAFFASVEQFDRPQLRGRPIAVVPVMAETTCCIAASYEAKAFDIRTGTAVGEALARCPELTLVLARPARYVEIHHQAMAAIADCIPHGEPESIDEVPCWLLGRERERANAEAIAQRIKRTLHERFDGAIRCSIGIAPNKFLAKTASDMQKPDGLTVIELADLPHALHRLELRDLCGIGPSIEHRLRGVGIRTVEQLSRPPPASSSASPGAAWRAIASGCSCAVTRSPLPAATASVRSATRTCSARNSAATRAHARWHSSCSPKRRCACAVRATARAASRSGCGCSGSNGGSSAI